MSTFNKLEIKDQRLVNRMARCQINFLSGTMSPAKSDPETMDIESFAHAMEHYSKRGCESVIVQPKYMGSRAQAYLWRDLDKCYAISRKGFVIKGVELEDAFKELLDRTLNSSKMEFEDVDHIIVDCELMPWSTLAKGMVEECFTDYADTVFEEIATLHKAGFYKQVTEKRGVVKDTDPSMNIIIPAFTENTLVDKFEKQVKLFGKELEEDQKPYFEPFNILKMVFKNGEEIITMHKNYNNSLALGTRYVRVNPSDWMNNELLSVFMNQVCNEELEGVVVKPLKFEWKEEMQYAPYLKVRNPEYLRIVYGHDYTHPEKLSKLVKKKSIGKKVGASLKDYRLGEKLLQIPETMVDSKNQEYKEILAELLVSSNRQKELDPRL